MLEHPISYPVIRKCNLSCTGCTAYSDHSESAKLPTVQNWKEELTLLKENVNPFFLGITGGEPLMHPEIQEIVEFARKTFSKVNISTNGLLIAENKWLQDMITNTEQDFFVTVSIHDSMSKNNKFSDMMHASLTQLISDKIGEDYNKISGFLNDFSTNGMVKENHIFRVHHEDHEIVQIKHTNLLLRFTGHFWLHPYLDDDELPVPFNNDSAEAYKDCFCPSLFYKDKKIFKCPLTTFLPDILNIKGDIRNWPYLEQFVPYDISVPNSKEIIRLMAHEDVCKHCPVNSKDQRVRVKVKDPKSKLYIIRESQ